MKFISKYNRVNVLTFVIALIASGICFYFVIRYLLRNQLDSDLRIEKEEVIDHIAKKGILPEPSLYLDQEISYKLIPGPVHEHFSNVRMRLGDDDDEEWIRQLDFSVQLDEKYYLFTVRKSQEETESLISVVVMSTLVIIILMLVLLFTINRVFFRKLWQPFNDALDQVRKFNLADKISFQAPKTEIDEFNELNTAIGNMAKTIENDYASLKNFTENASHEIQTPLAVIRSKLEMMMQAENIREQQMADLAHIADASDRLSRLNRSLILLTRIDNRQFKEQENVSLASLLEKELLYYEELIQAKQLRVKTDLDQHMVIPMNVTLAEVLISNLITNSIKHNIQGGAIDITLNSRSLSFKNTGDKPGLDPALLFERFKTASASKDSLGLGLSIVKKIGDIYKFDIQYTYSENMHRLSINFNI